MSYETAKKIIDIVNDIEHRKYFLPAIQREFIWTTDQITKLFDSLMRDYPINSFLLWQVPQNTIKKYEFYDFLKDYHEKDNRHNPKANINGKNDIVAVLDGQQRLTAIYIALKGSYTYKEPRKHHTNSQAYPKRHLYLNLTCPSKEQDLEYDFQFLTKQEVENLNDNHWYLVSDILNINKQSQITEYLIQNIWNAYSKDKVSFANNALSKLFSIIHLDSTISYYLEKSDDINKILNIFTRINSGGTILSYSDLLLSIASTQWHSKDAREEILNFVDEINSIGEGFKFNKDFILKSCLVLTDLDVAFKVRNFTKNNTQKIEQNWNNITKSIRITVNLISTFGFNRDTLISTNAIIPIAYYLNKINLPDTFDNSGKFKNDRFLIKSWLISSLLKKVFSGQPDNILRTIRKIIHNTSSNSFPYNEIYNEYKGTNKSLLMSDDEIENILEYSYGESITFSILSLLYPSFDFKNIFHIDHIYPKSFFKPKTLKKMGIPEVQHEFYLNSYNSIPNLQLLEDIPNIEKQDSLFEDWIQKNFKTNDEKAYYKKIHYIPDCDLSFNNFQEFFNLRKNLLIKKLKNLTNTN